jgi:hypothetical protein
LGFAASDPPAGGKELDVRFSQITRKSAAPVQIAGVSTIVALLA